MRTRSVLNTRLTPLAFALGLSLSLPAGAQDQLSVYEFNLAKQPISHTLTQVAKAASMNLIADAKLLNGLQAPALQGEISLNQALKLALQNSNLTARIIDNNITKLIVGSSHTMIVGMTRRFIYNNISTIIIYILLVSR